MQGASESEERSRVGKVGIREGGPNKICRCVSVSVYDIARELNAGTYERYVRMRSRPRGRHVGQCTGGGIQSNRGCCRIRAYLRSCLRMINASPRVDEDFDSPTRSRSLFTAGMGWPGLYTLRYMRAARAGRRARRFMLSSRVCVQYSLFLIPCS